VVVFTPRWIYSRGGKSLRYPLNRRLDGPQSPFGDFEEEKELLFLVGIRRFFCCPVVEIHFIDGTAAVTLIKDQFIY
jgi:hypothetical protein